MRRLTFSFLTIAIAILLFPRSVFAATVSVTTDKPSYSIGDIIHLTIKINDGVLATNGYTLTVTDGGSPVITGFQSYTSNSGGNVVDINASSDRVGFHIFTVKADKGGQIISGVSPSIAIGNPSSLLSVSLDKPAYAIGEKARLTAIIRSGSKSYTGVCVTYVVTLNGANFANNSGVCGTADLTDGSGSATWLLPAFTSNGTYSVSVTGAAQQGIIGTTSATAAIQVGSSTSSTSTTGTTDGSTIPPSSTDTGAGIQIPNPISCNDVNCVLTQVIKYVLGSVAILATLMFIWGGVLMLTSAGNEKRITQGRETIAWAAIGIIVILLSWTLVKFVLTGILGNRAKK